MTSPKYRPSASFLDQPSDSTTVRMGAPMSEIVLGGGDHFPYNGKAIKCSLCRTAANQITKQQKTMAAVIIPLAQRPWTTAANSTHDIWLYPKLLIAAVWQCTAVCNDSINGSAGFLVFYDEPVHPSFGASPSQPAPGDWFTCQARWWGRTYLDTVRWR